MCTALSGNVLFHEIGFLTSDRVRMSWDLHAPISKLSQTRRMDSKVVHVPVDAPVDFFMRIGENLSVGKFDFMIKLALVRAGNYESERGTQNPN